MATKRPTANAAGQMVGCGRSHPAKRLYSINLDGILGLHPVAIRPTSAGHQHKDSHRNHSFYKSKSTQNRQSRVVEGDEDAHNRYSEGDLFQGTTSFRYTCRQVHCRLIYCIITYGWRERKSQQKNSPVPMKGRGILLGVCMK